MITLTRRALLGGISAAAVAGISGIPAFAADDTIKIGILHSLSGTMAISETTLKDTMLMLIEQQNAKGGCARQEAGSSGRRPGFGLAAVCRKGP